MAAPAASANSQAQRADALDYADGTYTIAAPSHACSTLYCCLSCGMPFSFPDEAYTSEDGDVRALILFVHRLRGFVHAKDRAGVQTSASTAHWQLNKSHYLHRCPLFFVHTLLARTH